MSNLYKEENLIQLFGEKDYNMFLQTGFLKFSKWDLTWQQMQNKLPAIEASMLEEDEIKYYIHNNWFVFKYEKDHEIKFGIGIDHERSDYFDFMKG